MWVKILEVDEAYNLLNKLILKLSPKCQEIMEKILLDELNEMICKEMRYASMNMLYKKKSQCMQRLRILGWKDEQFKEFYNLKKSLS